MGGHSLAACRQICLQVRTAGLCAEQRGDTRTVRKLQQKIATQKIANSFYAKALAVRQVAQISNGRKTAGIDGVRSPTSAAKLQMATGLTIHHRPSPVRRKWIPKPGKDEMRPLGIPNLLDRAHQALLVQSYTSSPPLLGYHYTTRLRDPLPLPDASHQQIKRVSPD
jgi:hypothetical protein